MANHDLYQEVTNTFIALLEQDGIQSWRKAWKNISSSPVNIITGTQYRGWNWFSLTLAAGPRPNQWATFKQVQSQNGHIRKGSAGVKIGFYTPREKHESGDEQTSDEVLAEKSHRFIFRIYHVFNALDIEGITVPSPVPFEGNAIQSLMTVCLSKLKKDGLVYKRVGNKAAYWPKQDIITMPEGSFDSPQDYCAILAHEMTHATESRLGRREKINDWFPDFDESYAFEELVAELGAAFICAHFNIKGDYDNHASYLHSWLKILKGDKFTLYRAVKLAQEAADWLLDQQVAPALQEAA